jgi:8-oxo-dGTP pyrophosphatase MutT (NUDIX family)
VPPSVRFIVAVAFLIERDGCLLMIRRSADRDHAPGEWECGSGRLEEGEEPRDAVIREAHEETGLEVEVVGLVDAFHYHRGPEREPAVCIAYHCRARGGEVRLSNEHDASRWVPLERLAEIPVSGRLRACLARFVERRRAP